MHNDCELDWQLSVPADDNIPHATNAYVFKNGLHMSLLV